MRSQISPRRSIARATGVAVCLFVAAVAAASLQGQMNKQKVIVHLTHYTDNLHAAKMAVHLANLMQASDGEVTLLLDLEGVRLASAKDPQDLIWGKGDPISKEYDAFVRAGGKVLLCPHCSEHAGVVAGAMRAGARIGEAGELAKTILAAEKVLDY